MEMTLNEERESPAFAETQEPRTGSGWSSNDLNLKCVFHSRRVYNLNPNIEHDNESQIPQAHARPIDKECGPGNVRITPSGPEASTGDSLQAEAKRVRACVWKE